jgi:hypothetical protein
LITKLSLYFFAFYYNSKMRCGLERAKPGSEGLRRRGAAPSGVCGGSALPDTLPLVRRRGVRRRGARVAPPSNKTKIRFPQKNFRTNLKK